MLKKIKQISLFSACMIILLHATIPHHHHYDKPVCINPFNHQDCNNHNNCCDFGGHDNNHDYDESNCIIDDYFTPKDDNNEINTYARMYLQDMSAIFNLAHNSITTGLIHDEKILRRNNQTPIYKDPLAISNLGLRAPPFGNS